MAQLPGCHRPAERGHRHVRCEEHGSPDRSPPRTDLSGGGEAPPPPFPRQSLGARAAVWRRFRARIKEERNGVLWRTPAEEAFRRAASNWVRFSPREEQTTETGGSEAKRNVFFN
jgi:hypothetical protein